ncbi:MAG: acyltransferase domain-containing protein [Acetobacteraceae bacterium]|nr:acyltransferase domain-containing protein [Acetobacteraceae bacterium]
MDRVVVFPGQGSQAVGMADAWLEHPVGRTVLERASEALGRDVVAGCRDEGALSTTAFVQPALLACGVAAFRVLEDEGATEWAGAAGHSLGEFAALVAADVLSFEDALEVVRVRGEAMQRAGEARPGGMAALLGIDAQEAERIGLVNRVVPGPDLLPTCLELARKIMSRAPLAVSLAKTVLNGGAGLAPGAALLLERLAQAVLFTTADRLEGTAAFLEKRPPRFEGR